MTSPTLCRSAQSSCGACCFQPQIKRAVLTRRLRRHRRLAAREPSLKSAKSRLRHERRARRNLDRLLSRLFPIPILGPWLQAQLEARMVCAFLAFEDAEERRVHCLIHPSVLGSEQRQSAFQELEGFACGAPDYLCRAARDFQSQQPGACSPEHPDWFQHSQAVHRYNRRPCSSSERE